MDKEFKINVFFNEEGIEVNSVIEKYLLSILQSWNSHNWGFVIK